MAIPNLKHVGLWHAKGPQYDAMFLLLGDEHRGFVHSVSIIYPDRRDTKTGVFHGLTLQQAIANAGGSFAQITAGDTKLGRGWSETTRIVVNGTREQLMKPFAPRDSTSAGC